MAWARRDGGVDAARVELISELLINFTVLLQSLLLALDGAALLGVLTGFIRFINLLLVQLDVVLLEVPLSEGGGINRNNGVLHEGLGSDKLIVRRVVNAIKNSGLGRHGLGAPGEVALVSSESSALDVVATSANVDALLGTKLGHGRHSAHFELSLFLVNRHAATSGSPLVSRVPRNTHTS